MVMAIAILAWSAVLSHGVVFSLASEAPFIVTPPQGNTNAPEGSDFTFTVEAGGSSPLSYQWVKNFEEIPGATLSSLTLRNLTQNDSGLYQVIVSNSFGSVRSTTNLLRAVDGRRRFTAVASAEPIAVPSSIIPTFARSRFWSSQP